MHPVWRTLAECSGGHVLALDGVTACVVPAVPDRSLPNSVLYEEPDAAAEQLDDLAAAYDAAGVRAWTVWVHPGDDALARTLAARGHVLDATPTAMNLDDLGRLPAARELPPGVTIEHPGDAAVLGRLNDEAYGLPVGTFGD